MEKPKGCYDEWLKSQEELMDSWSENVKKAQQSFMGPGGGREALAKDAGKLFIEMYDKWLTSLAYSIPDSREYPTGVLKEALLKSRDGSNVYAKLYEVWLPLVQAMEEKAMDVDSYKGLIDPEKYKEVIDTVFGLNPEAVKELYGQASKLLDTWGASAKEFVSPWSDALENNIRALPKFMQGHPDSMINVFHNAFESYDKSFGRFLHMHAVGKDREKIELFLRGFDDLAVYITKYVKYHQMMYVTGLKAVEKVIEAFAEKLKAGEIRGFNEFFDLWLEVNENKYMELGRTAEYSKIQGEMMNSALTVRGHYFKLMELNLYDVPVALRSEMDDLYKTVYALKKKVRSLEKQVTELSKGEETA